MAWTKQLIEAALAEGDIVVDFTKEDGSVRTMLATRDKMKIPTSKLPTPEQTEDPNFVKEVENLDLVKVFDLEKNDWRSFRPSTVISVTQL